jgi:hypothetical protein
MRNALVLMPCMLLVLCSEALEVLISLGIPRVLTSGGQPRAMQVRRATFGYKLYVPKLKTVTWQCYGSIDMA